MHIGLIGGIGPAATDLYYRGLIASLRAEGRELDATIVHADSVRLLANFNKGDAAAQTEIYLSLADRLVAAGADAMAITSIGGHFCVDMLRPRCPLPLIELPGAINAEIAARGLTKVGLLGTDTVMETGVYGGVTAAETLAPEGDSLAAVHQAYTDMATKATVTDAQRALFFEEGQAMTARGAEAILLAGTDLFVAFEGHDPGFLAIDCAEIHVAAIVKAILASS